MYIHFMEMLRHMAPASEFPSMEGRLREKFMVGLLDHELKGQAERNVPPGDIKAMGAFRPGC